MEVQTLLPIQQHRLNMTATVVKEEVPDSPMVSSRIGPLSSSNFTTPTTNKVCSTTTSDLNQNNNSSNFNLSVLLTDRSQAMCRNSPMGNSPTTNGQPKLTPVISPLSPIKNMKVQPPPKSNPPMTNLPAPPGNHIPPGLEFSTSPNSTTTNSVRVRTPVHSQPVVTSSVMGNAISHSDVAKKNHGNSKTTANDPLSHRIIEKRRRDRMNNCLADLSRLIPTYYLKKGRGRIEKTEIIEMAIKYIKHLQAHACSNIESCDVTAKQERAGKELEQFNLGYQECISEVMHFLVESEGLYSGDSLCVRLVNHLTKHCEKILASEGYISRQNGSSSASSSSGYHANGSSTGSSSDGNGNGSNHASDTKEALLTEESAYRSDERQGSDEAEDMPPNFTGSNLSNMEGGHGTAGAPLQLRDMLQNASAEGPRPYSNYVSCNGPSSNNSSSGDDNAGRLYKFKSNMKHRFSVDLEHSHKNKKQRRDSESSCGNYTDYEKDCQGNHVNQRSGTRPSNYPNNQHNLSKMEDEWDSSPHPEKTETMTPPPLGPNCNSLPAQTRNILDPTKHVPIFALNQNGTYVPLVIDHSIVAPVMDNLQDITTVPHPISIYVNFCSPYHVPLTGPPVAPMGHSLKTPTSTLAQPHYPPSHMPFPNPQTIPHLDNYAPRGHYPDDRRRGGGQYHDRHSRLVSNSQPQSTVATIADSSEKKEPMSSDYRDIPMSNVQMRSDQPPVLHEFMNQMRHPDIRQHDLHRDSREVCDSRESFRHQRTIRDGREPRELAMREGFEPSFMAGNYPRAHIPWAYHASNTKPYKE